MPTIDLDQPTYERLAFGARMSQSTIPEVIARLLDEAIRSHDEGDETAPALDASAPVNVHAVYQRTKITAVFEPSSGEVKITSGPLAGKMYTSPSAAAIAVVEQFNPGRAHSNTNGRTFWIIDQTGKTLRSILGRR